MGNKNVAKFHLPGLFEFYEFYKEFLPLFYNHREYFYDWVEIASIYGAPDDTIWGGGRLGLGENNAEEVLGLVNAYGISARLTFSNSLLEEKHLSDKKCNKLCKLFEKYADNILQVDTIKTKTENKIRNGVIVHSDLLLNYLMSNYPELYYVSSTTKVITDFDEFKRELDRDEFLYVVPDFRLNKRFEELSKLTDVEKDKVEFLCNECCYVGCMDRKACYESVSRRILDEMAEEHICKAPNGNEGYKFSKAMKSPAFISVEDIIEVYMKAGFSNFKIEGRELGSALVLEMLLYYMVKPEYQIEVREELYLDNMLNLY